VALTPREQEILEALAEGLSNRLIAGRLAISSQTVKFHVAAILAKLGAGSRTEAVTFALRQGLIAL
jgi:DNA-binding NarL/FixJ family response regulator